MTNGVEGAEIRAVTEPKPAWDVTSSHISTLREKALEYRFLGDDLVLLDVHARLIVDVMRAALPR
jgi:hypothetical protein